MRPARRARPSRLAASGPTRTTFEIFLAGLRGLDSERARRVFDGRAIAHAQGYTVARSAAAQIGLAKRKTEWQLAREAASVIARGKLGDTTLTEQVVDVLADAAGAIAIRDLLSRSYYKTLLLPWTWRSARVAPAVTLEPRPAAPASVPIAGQAAAQLSVGVTPDAVPAARWAEAFGSKWPPPRELEAPVASVAPVAHEPRLASPVAAALAAPTTPPPVAALPAAPVAVAPTIVAAEPSISLPPPVSKAADPASSRISIADLGESPWKAGIDPRPEPVRAIPATRAVAGAPRPGARRISWVPAAALLLVVIAVGGVVAALSRPPAEQAVAAITDDPLTPTNEATGFVVAPPASDPATIEPTPTDVDPATPVPVVTDPPGGGPAPPGPDPTPKPPKPTPRPTAPPTPAPTQAPTPAPTPTPEPACLVPNFINTQATKALQKWTGSGFTGPLTLDPMTPPNYQIGWQSLNAGDMAPCTSGITVSEVAP